MTTNEKENRLKDALRQTRYAIIGRGGEISETAGLKDLRGAIFNIPADNAITTMTVDGYYSDVPENATSYAYVSAFGGLTYRIGNDYYDNTTGEYVEKWELYNQFPRSIYFNGFDVETGEEFHDEIIIPEEMLNLPDYGDGINLEYYNKVDLVNQKYKSCIETFVFDGSEGTGSSSRPTGWRRSGSGESAYFFIKIGEFGEYAIDGTIICDKYETAEMSGTTNIGVYIFNSSVSSGVCVGFRPENVSEITSTGALVAYLANNPITVKVARTVPVETDLPVRMNPLLRVWGGKGYIESSPWDGEYYPVEVIVQTRTQ